MKKLDHKFKFYPYIIAIIAVLQISGVIYSRYWIDAMGAHLPLGTLLFTPMILFIFQIVSECYGWQYARQIIWINLLVNLLFTSITLGSSLIAISDFTHLNLKLAYNSLINTIWVISFMSAIAIFIAQYIISVLMVFSRLYFSGRYLLFRVLVIHCVVEVVLLSTSFIIMPYNGYSFSDIYNLVVQLFIARSIFGVFLALCTVIIIWLIQNKVEHLVCFDLVKDWSIFKLQINDKLLLMIDSTLWQSMRLNKKQFTILCKDMIESKPVFLEKGKVNETS